MSARTLLLVDGHALVHRAFHAIPASFMTSRGEPTNAVYGFTSMLLKVLGDLRPELVALAFDLSTPTFRHLASADYKANRPRISDDLRNQFGRVRQIVHAFGIPIYERDGFEADDVLGTLARQATAEGVRTVIVTGDMDTLQLVDEHVRVLAQKGRIAETVLYDPPAVREKYGLEPAQVPDLKALSGDTSDNIKGVPGIGEKTAQRLLADFETVEGLYARIDDVPARWRTTLAEHEGQVRSNKRLATIDCHVPIELDLEAARLEGYDRSQVLTLFQELEFRTLVDKMPQVGEPDRSGQAAGAGENGKARAGAESPGEEGLVSSVAGLRAVSTGLLAAGDFVLHPVVITRSVVDHDLLGFALALEDGPAWYAPVGGPLSEEAILDVLRPVLESADAGKVAHDAKLLHTLLAERGITLRGVAFDTMIAGYLSNPANRASTIKDLAFKELGQDMAGVATLAPKGSTLRDVPPEEVGREAIAEARLIQRLAGSLRDDLQERSQLELFETVELPLTPVLSRMERAGIKVDERILGEMARELAAQIREAELAVYNAVGHQFTINSTQQLARVLVEELHLPLTKRTKTGYSTDATVLEELVGVHPVIEHILRYRQLTKLKSTYVDALPALINSRTGRVHTTFNQAVAATGRLSSENPNLQNIPVRTELGRAIRRAFVAEGPDAVLFAADYAQIELRIAAHITRDPLLVEAFQRDEDVHAATAATVFGVPLERVTDEQRRLAKTTNFAVLYGISDFGLSQRVGIARSDAAPFIKSYLEKYRGINAYIHSTLKGARERGYVETPLGRRRYIPELRSNNPAVRGAGERMAINMPIQGAQADLIKLAMIRIERALEGSGLGARMLLQVHDELVFETPREEVPRLARLAQEAMEGALELIVPIKVEMKVGTNWYDLAPLNVPTLTS